MPSVANRTGVVTDPSDRVIYLTVHGIGEPIRPLAPGEHLTWVDIDRFRSALDAVRDRPDVRITFDDGNLSDVTIGLPMLLERGLRAEFYLLAGRLGEPGRVGEEHIGQLLAAGMTIGSHGWSHVDWRRLDEPGMRRELLDAPSRLAELSGGAVRAVAVPFGSYDRTVLTRLRRAGMTTVLTSDGGPARPDAWLRPRTSLRHDLTPEWLARALEPSPPISSKVRRAAARTVKRWR
jgi:peptidoglycan/xylan/chitin deacetylase (PgdA/CDA1 family)